MAARFKKVTTVKHTKEHNKKHSIRHRKIPKISPGAYIFQRPFLRGLSTEGNFRFIIDWASLIVVGKFTIFALFYFLLEGNFEVQAPPRGYIWRGLYMEGLIFGIL